MTQLDYIDQMILAENAEDKKAVSMLVRENQKRREFSAKQKEEVEKPKQKNGYRKEKKQTFIGTKWGRNRTLLEACTAILKDDFKKGEEMIQRAKELQEQGRIEKKFSKSN